MTKRIVGVLAAVTTLAVTGTAMAFIHFWTPWFSEETSNGRQNWRTCGGNYAVEGMAASGSYSDNLALGCVPWALGSLALDTDTARSYWSNEFSNEGNSGIENVQCATFPDGHQECDTIPTGSNLHVCFGGFGSLNKGVVTGMACYLGHCDNLRLQCKKPNSGRLGDCSWSGWFSDEQASVDFGPGRYVTGVECSGDRCDNMRFYVCSAKW